MVALSRFITRHLDIVKNSLHLIAEYHIQSVPKIVPNVTSFYLSTKGLNLHLNVPPVELLDETSIHGKVGIIRAVITAAATE